MITSTKVYIADNEDLILYKNDDILGFTFEVLNKPIPPAEGTPYDFTGFTDVFLKIYKGRKEPLLVTIPNGNPGVQIAANIITWNSDYSDDINLSINTYYYELSYLDANSKLITVLFGDLTVI